MMVTGIEALHFNKAMGFKKLSCFRFTNNMVCMRPEAAK